MVYHETVGTEEPPPGLSVTPLPGDTSPGVRICESWRRDMRSGMMILLMVPPGQWITVPLFLDATNINNYRTDLMDSPPGAFTKGGNTITDNSPFYYGG
ncbi:MAG: hypothetical protein DRN55_08600 [Thermoplasmata archaeon]|nr:MAG: hypothetical protein DRN55_08600 [Thermoplasmata archaeon]